MNNKVKHKKDNKISIIEKSYKVHDDGYQEAQYKYKYKDIWSYYRHLSGKEIYSAATINHKVEVMFEINYKDNIDTTMAILYKNELYEITDIDDFEGKKQSLKIYAYKVNDTTLKDSIQG